MKRILICIVCVLCFASCVKLDAIKVTENKIQNISFDSLGAINLTIAPRIFNTNKDIKVLSCEFDLYSDKQKIAKARLTESFVIRNGEETTQVPIRINLAGGLNGYLELIRTISSSVDSIYARGFVVVKVGMFKKKIKIQDIRLRDIPIINELVKGISENSIF